jgi:outer membrane protein OmpA-like peptidoglycan-associated protein
MAEDDDRHAILLRRTRFVAAALAGMLAPACAPAAPAPVTAPPTPTAAPTTAPPRPPPGDQDADGVMLEADRCPGDREDRDGLQDDDGCPEDDADGDLIHDVDDVCPATRGVVGTRPDHRGCPPTACLTIVKELLILERQEFDVGSAVVPASSKALDDVAQVLLERPELKIEIEGHSSRGERNPALALARAKAVHVYLVKKGVAADRMTPKGSGHDAPRAHEETPDGRARNRRVEFRVTSGF